MSGCSGKNCSVDALRERQRGTLQIVLGINAVMFLVIVAVWLSGSGWPDALVALGLVWLLMRSAIRVISSAMAELRAAT